MTTRMAVLALVVAVGLAGCTTPSGGPGERPSSTPAPPSSADRPRDRDSEAVLAALRRLDLCAVVAAATTTAPIVPAAEPVTSQPFSCTVGEPFDQFTAKVVSFTHSSRVTLPIRPVGGAKAYVRDAADGCAVYLPVSFHWAVEFSQRTACQSVTAVVAAAASVLAEPGAGAGEPWWDACTALAKALEPEADQSTLSGNDLASCTYLAGEKARRASLVYAEPERHWGPPQESTIGDLRVWVYQDDQSCGVHWRQGANPSPYARAPDSPVFVASPDCAYSTELAEAVAEVLAGPAPVDSPQHPLLYGPGEPDGPYLGDCAYLEDENDARRCEPAGDVPVPDDLTGTGDARVMCAASADAVREHFGGRLRPVAVVGEGCHFVEAEREIVVTFAVRSGTPGGGGGREVTIAGRHGFVEARAGGFDYTVAVDGGVVELTVEVGPVGTDLPPGSDTMAEAVIADLAAA